MKFPNLLLTIVGMLSTPVTLANVNEGDIVPMTFSDGWAPAPSLIGRESTAILELRKEEGQAKGGYINYRIHVNAENAEYHSGYDFRVQFTEMGECKISDTNSLSLNGGGFGPYTYSVEVVQGQNNNGIPQCDVKINEIPKDKIVPVHYQDLNVGEYLCNNTTSVKVGVSKVKTFKVNNDNYLAVLVNNYSGDCTRDPSSTKDMRGVHIYKWMANGANQGKIEYVHQQFINFENLQNTIPTLIEYFDKEEILIIGGAYSESSSKEPEFLGVTQLYQFDFTGGLVDIDSRLFIGKCTYVQNGYVNMSGNFCGTNELKLISKDEQTFLLSVNGGNRRDQFTKKSILQKWDSTNKKFGDVEKEPILTQAGQDATSFTYNGYSYIFIANRNNESSPETFSQLFLFDPNNVTLKLQRIPEADMPTYMLNDVEHFKILSGEEYFLFANTVGEHVNGEQSQYRKHRLYRFNGSKIVPVEDSIPLDIPNLTKWKHTVINNKDYFIATHPYNNKTLLYSLCNKVSLCPATIDNESSNYALVGAPGVNWDITTIEDAQGLKQDYLIRYNESVQDKIAVTIIKLTE